LLPPPGAGVLFIIGRPSAIAGSIHKTPLTSMPTTDSASTSQKPGRLSRVCKPEIKECNFMMVSLAG
jgi:hypothetical protein